MLVCNRPDWVDELLEGFRLPENPQLVERWQYMAGRGTPDDYAAVMQQPEFQAAQAFTAALSSPQDLVGGVKVGEAF